MPLKGGFDYNVSNTREERRTSTTDLQYLKKSEGGNKGNHLLGFNEIERKWGPFGSYTTKGLSLSHYFEKKIVNKEVLCNLQLSHKHSGLGYAQMVGKCEFDFIHKI